MKKKTLAEILAEPATVEAIIKKAMEINELLLKVENMPEVEIDPSNYIKIKSEGECTGCVFDLGFGCSILETYGSSGYPPELECRPTKKDLNDYKFMRK